MINRHTRTLKLERGEVIDLMIMLTAVSDAGTKWTILHDKIKEQLDAQDKRDEGIKDLDLFP